MIRFDSVSLPQKPSRCTNSPVPAEPACGPAAVAQVPALMATKAYTHSARTDQTTERSERTARIWSGSSRERHHSANEAISSSIDTR